MENQQRAASLAAVPRTAKNVHVRSISGFIVAGRGPGGLGGVVNPGEIVEVSRAEAFDIVAAGRGELATAAEIAAGPAADFIPKDADGNVIAPDRRSRAQTHAAMRAQQNQTAGRRGAA